MPPKSPRANEHKQVPPPPVTKQPPHDHRGAGHHPIQQPPQSRQN